MVRAWEPRSDGQGAIRRKRGLGRVTRVPRLEYFRDPRSAARPEAGRELGPGGSGPIGVIGGKPYVLPVAAPPLALAVGKPRLVRVVVHRVGLDADPELIGVSPTLPESRLDPHGQEDGGKRAVEHRRVVLWGPRLQVRLAPLFERPG